MPDPTRKFKMKQGSREVNTPGPFRREAQPNLDSISRARTSRVERMVSERINNPPSYTDSLAVYNRNSGTGAKVYNPIANAAEKKYGKIDVSGFKPSINKKPDLASARKKYNL